MSVHSPRNRESFRSFVRYFHTRKDMERTTSTQVGVWSAMPELFWQCHSSATYSLFLTINTFSRYECCSLMHVALRKGIQCCHKVQENGVIYAVDIMFLLHAICCLHKGRIEWHRCIRVRVSQLFDLLANKHYVLL